jgi:protease-4
MADNDPSGGARTIQGVIVLVGLAVSLVAGYLGFIVVPRATGVGVGNVVLVLLLGFGGLYVSRNVASSLIAPYNVAEVGVRGPILRDAGSYVPFSPGMVTADDVVEQIERADADPNAEALVVRLNTPGGQVVPSDDIRQAVADFDGPTVGYATDVCASGGYWIASACDEIHARETSLVGSIGVLGSRVVADEMAEKLGLRYERIVAGRYKDAGSPMKELDDEERSYLEGLVEGFYDAFVETVTASRDLTEEEVRDTEARVYLGEEAVDVGLVDEVGPRQDVEDRVGELIGAETAVREFEPERGLRSQLTIAGLSAAHALGGDVDGMEFRVER